MPPRTRCSVSSYQKYPKGNVRGARGVESRLAVVSPETLRRDDRLLRTRGRPTFRARTTARRGCTGRPRARSAEAGDGGSSSATPWCVTDYLNSYYGRLAAKRLGHRRCRAACGRRRSCIDHRHRAAGRRRRRPRRSSARCSTAELYDDALNELRYAQRIWGDSPAIQATIAWTNQQQSRRQDRARSASQLLRGVDHARCGARIRSSWRPAAKTCRATCCTVIFPLAYWDLIQQVRRGEQSRSVSDRRARRAGVDVRRRHPVARERLRPDAADAVDGAAVRAEAEAALLAAAADRSRSEHPDGHGVLRRQAQGVRRRASGAGQLQRRRPRRCAGGWPSGPASSATSSSTTSRTRRRRTT